MAGRPTIVAELSLRRLVRLAPGRLIPPGRLRSADPMAPWYPRHRAAPPARQARTYALALVQRSGKRHGNPFLIFAQGRTGSSLLVDLLNSSPDVHCDEEILTKPVVLPRLWIEGRRVRRREPVYGFKVKPYQLTIDQGFEDPGDWLAAMHRSGWRVVHLERRNLLRQVLSSVVATRDQRYRSLSPPDGPRPPLRVDPAEIVYWLGVRERVGAAERAALGSIPHERVVYEDDLARPDRHQATLDRLAAALGFETAPATTELRRINPSRLPDLVENHHELERALRATRWAEYLE